MLKTAFLHGDLEDIYMMQPQGYIMLDKEHLVCNLKKILYDLKQALGSDIWSLTDLWLVVDAQDCNLIIVSISSILKIHTPYYLCM